MVREEDAVVVVTHIHGVGKLSSVSDGVRWVSADGVHWVSVLT